MEEKKDEKYVVATEKYYLPPTIVLLMYPGYISMIREMRDSNVHIVLKPIFSQIFILIQIRKNRDPFFQKCPLHSGL